MITIHDWQLLRKYLQLIMSRYCKRDSSSTLNTEENYVKDHIVWLNMEMTGFDVNKCHILEVACLITDKHLKVISKDLNIVIHQPHRILQNMNAWCLETHKNSGLIN